MLIQYFLGSLYRVSTTVQRDKLPTILPVDYIRLISEPLYIAPWTKYFADTGVLFLANSNIKGFPSVSCP